MSVSCGKILSTTELERYRVRVERTLPVKGKKEFAPTGTWVECKQLEAARDERHALLQEERVERVGALSVAEWDEKMNLAVVTYSVGKHWENFGHHQEQLTLLHPEEALFLLETSNLLLLHNNVGMSVQQGYNTLLGQRTGCTLDCYRVFSHLARQGFRLKRHAGPVFVLTDYERRIGLQSYLYPSRHSVGSMQEHHNDLNKDSEKTNHHENSKREGTMTLQRKDDVVTTSSIKMEDADMSEANHVNVDTLMSVTPEGKLITNLGDDVLTSTVKREDMEAVESANTEISSDVPGSAFKREQPCADSKHVEESVWEPHNKSGTCSETHINKRGCSSLVTESDIQSIKREHGTGNCSSNAVYNEINDCECNVIISDLEMEAENDVEKNIVKYEDFVSETRCKHSSDTAIKKETVVSGSTENVSVEITDSCDTIESTEKGQASENCRDTKTRESSKVSDDKITKEENLKTSHEICFVSDSSISGYSDIVVELEELEKNKACSSTNATTIVNLINSDENESSDFRRKRQSPRETVVTDKSSCTVDTKAITAQKPSHNNSLKCEIDITDISSAEETVDIYTDNTDCKVKGDILCVDYKRKVTRKRHVSGQKSSLKSEKTYVVDVETGAVMRSDEKFVPEKIAKRAYNKETNEIIVIDDADSAYRKNVSVELNDDELELELSKFYKEITLVDLTDDDSSTKTRNEILDLFPNFAGVQTATVRAPPSNLLPENVTPSQNEYEIDLQNLIGERPSWVVRRHLYRAREAHQRFKHRRGHHGYARYHGSPHRRIPDDRTFSDPQNVSEDFSRNNVISYDRRLISQNYSDVFNSQPHAPLAVIDTAGTFVTERRFEHQQRFLSGNSNKQWYDRTWSPRSQNGSFRQINDSPSHSPQHYEHNTVFMERQHYHQRQNRRYSRNTNDRRNPSSRSQFRSSNHPAPYREQPNGTDSIWEQAPDYNWQKVRNVVGSAENWSDIKKMLSCRNVQESVMKDEPGSSLEIEEDENEEMELPVEPLGEDSEEDIEWKPLIQPSDCIDTGSILTKLNIFKEVSCGSFQTTSVETRLKVNYDLYLPTTKFKKSSPCLPDYRLCIIGCQGGVPSAGEAAFLLKELQDDVPLLFAAAVPDSVAFYHFANISLPVDDSFPV